MISDQKDYATAKVINKNQAIELLKSKMNLTNKNYKYTGIDKFGGYICSYTGKDTTQNHIAYVINPYTGNVYDEVSSKCITNLIYNIDKSSILSVDEVKDLLISDNIVNLSDNTSFDFYTFEAGDIIIALFDKNYNVITKYRINPVNLDVYDYTTGKFIKNLKRN